MSPTCWQNPLVITHCLQDKIKTTGSSWPVCYLLPAPPFSHRAYSPAKWNYLWIPKYITLLCVFLLLHVLLLLPGMPTAHHTLPLFLNEIFLKSLTCKNLSFLLFPQYFVPTTIVPIGFISLFSSHSSGGVLSGNELIVSPARDTLLVLNKYLF